MMRMPNQMPEQTDRATLLRRVQMADFVLGDAVLYLDGHPEDQKALAYYADARDRAVKLADQYEAEYGPLTYYGETGNNWSWVSDPWPWELTDAVPASDFRRLRAVRGAR